MSKKKGKKLELISTSAIGVAIPTHSSGIKAEPKVFTNNGNKKEENGNRKGGSMNWADVEDEQWHSGSAAGGNAGAAAPGEQSASNGDNNWRKGQAPTGGNGNRGWRRNDENGSNQQDKPAVDDSGPWRRGQAVPATAAAGGASSSSSAADSGPWERGAKVNPPPNADEKAQETEGPWRRGIVPSEPSRDAPASKIEEENGQWKRGIAQSEQPAGKEKELSTSAADSGPWKRGIAANGPAPSEKRGEKSSFWNKSGSGISEEADTWRKSGPSPSQSAATESSSGEAAATAGADQDQSASTEQSNSQPPQSRKKGGFPTKNRDKIGGSGEEEAAGEWKRGVTLPSRSNERKGENGKKDKKFGNFFNKDGKNEDDKGAWRKAGNASSATAAASPSNESTASSNATAPVSNQSEQQQQQQQQPKQQRQPRSNQAPKDKPKSTQAAPSIAPAPKSTASASAPSTSSSGGRGWEKPR